MISSRTEMRCVAGAKLLVFAACLIPLLWCVIAIVGGPVPSLGVDPVRAVLGIFGHTALNLLLLTLAITPLRDITGYLPVLKLRRMLGLFAFFYALMHFLTYLGPFEGFSVRAAFADVAKRPYATIGFTALLLLVPLAVTSTSRWMRRLKRRWQQLHRLVYLIATLAVVHYTWSVKKDLREPFLYITLLATLLGYRLLKWWMHRPRIEARGAAGVRVSSPSG